LENLDSSIDIVTRHTADTVESPASRNEIIVLAAATNRPEGTRKSSGTLNGIFTFLGVDDLIAVLVATAVNRTFLRGLGAHAGLVAGTAVVASVLLADLSTEDAVVVSDSSLSSEGDNLVDVLTETQLFLETETILLRVSLLVAPASILERNILLTDGTISTFETTVAGLTKVQEIRRASDVEELLDGVLLHVSITILAGFSGVGDNPIVSISVEIADGDGSGLSILQGRDPATRPAGSNIDTNGLIHEASVGRAVGRSRGGSVHVLGEVLLVEHGAGHASLDEEDPALVVLLLTKSVEQIGHIVTGEITTIGHGNDVNVAVVIIVEEDIIVLGGLEGLATAGLGDFTLENSKKVFSSSILSNIILDNTVIDVHVVATTDVEVVEDLTRERVLVAIGNIISHEDDDTAVRNTKLASNLVHVTHGCLVTIVVEVGRTSSQNDPSVFGIGFSILIGQSTF